MEENSELEEGEACSYSDDDEKNVDPDIAFSYMDEKIQNILGHFQKDFEGEVSTEYLGAKFGGYGSFLPTYERSRPHPTTPQRSSNTARSPSKLPVEGGSQRLKVPTNTPAPVKYSSNGFNSSGVAPGDASAKQGPGFSSTSIPQKTTVKDEKSGFLSKQRTLKVRIKVGSDNMEKKSAAIYSGLGLDNSPSSSLGNGPEESGQMLQEIADESPTSILQVMTAFPIPGDLFLSPLHDNLLCLIGEEALSQDNKPRPYAKVIQEHSALLDGSVSSSHKISKKKETKLRRKGELSAEQKHGNGSNFENDTQLPLKKKLEKDSLDVEDIMHCNSRSMPLSNAVSVGDTWKVSNVATEVTKKTDTDKVRKNLSSDLVNEENSLELISGQDVGKNEKRDARSSSVEKVSKNRALGFGSKGHKGDQTVGRPKTHSNASKCKEDLNVGSVVSQKLKIDKQATFHVLDSSTVSSEEERPLLEGEKRLHCIHSGKKEAAMPTKESLRIGPSAPKDAISADYGASTSRPKERKMKSQIEIHKSRDNYGDPVEEKLEQTNKGTGNSDRASFDRVKGPGNVDVEFKPSPAFIESKERSGGKRVANQAMPQSSVNGAANGSSHVSENALANEMAPPAVYPVVEDWVCCDSCQTWRLLPFGLKPDQLPEKWTCSMLNWLPGMNRCDISEEETTKALNALYQLPPAGGQSNGQNLVNGTASGVAPAHLQHFDHNHQFVNSQAVSSRGKKKHGLKDKEKAGSWRSLMQTSNPMDSHLQGPSKSRSVNDMSQPLAEPNYMNKSGVDHLSNSQNWVTEKHIPDQKENNINEGDVMQVKMKSKRETYHGCGISKKTKMENVSYPGKDENSDRDIGIIDIKSKVILSTKSSEKKMQKSNDGSFSDDVKSDAKEKKRVSSIKPKEQARESFDGGSLDFKTGNSRDTSQQKRKLEEWVDTQNGHDNLINAEGSTENGLKGQKRNRISNLSKDSSSNGTNDKSKKENSAAHRSKDQPIDGLEEVRNVDKDHQSWKSRQKLSSKRTSDDIDSFRKDLGFGQVSASATSSSSKVSGSLKIKITSNDVKASPVESVSSSPLRAIIPEKPALAGRGGGKDNTTISGVPVVCEPRGYWDVEGDSKINQSWTARKEKVYVSSDPESLKSFPLDYRDGDANNQSNGRTKLFHLIKCDAIVGHGQGSSDQLPLPNCHYEERMDKELHGNVLPPQKSGRGSSISSKNNERTSKSGFNRDNMVSGPVGELGDLHSKKNTQYESEVDPKVHTPAHRKMNIKQSVPNKSSTRSSKFEKDYVMSNSTGQCSKEVTLENQLKLEERSDSDTKVGVLRGMKCNTATQLNLMQDVEGDTNVSTAKKESRGGIPNLHSHFDSVMDQESQIHLPSQESQMGGTFDGSLVHALGASVASKALRPPGNAGTRSIVHASLGHQVTDLKGNSTSTQTAATALKEAKDLRNYADRLKGSGFGFESNEAYFQSALKFLRGGSLLEACNSEGGKQGEMNQIQAFSITAKLCEGCALEYEKHYEMAAAALAYKCMEVAYWRLVYCKSSGSSRDRNELQASLQMVPQGESPSSSASDIDNLNNQSTVDRATSSRGATSNVSGNPVIVARNHSNFLRLLDFTQDVNFAVEASRKSQNALLAANVVFDEAQNECVTSIKRVIDFSFQDIDGLIRLVQLAMEAISRSGFGRARD